MVSKPPAPLSEAEIHALIDEQGSAPELAALRARLAMDPTAQATLLKWQQQRQSLRQLYLHVLNEPVAPSLVSAAGASTLSSDTPEASIGSRWAGVAASIVLSFGLGWSSHSVLNRGSAVETPVKQIFVHQATVAHAVYSPEVRHPVEVGAAEQEHLVQWLSKRVGKPLKVPQLNAQGFDLVGGRLLPGDGGARAQFMFQNNSGIRVTLYLGAILAPQATTGNQETAFSYVEDGATPSFYWIEQGFGYALTGAMSRTKLLSLAEEVYRQLEHAS